MPLDPEFAAEIAQQLYGLRAIAKPLPGELDDNFKLEDSDGNHFILKIAHPDADVKYLAFQNDLLLHLDGKGLNTQVQAVVPTIEGTFIGTATDPEGRSRYVRLLTWVPGSLWAGLKYRSEELLFSLGAACGSLCAVLEGFDHPGAHRQLKWDLLQAEWTAPHLDAIEEEEVREQATAFLAAFRRQVLPQLPSLRKSVIHNDANDYNVLVDGDPGNQRVSGIIDFGDAVYTATVCDLAIAITYGVMGCREPLEAAVQIVRGFNEAYPLRENELALLHTLVGTRLLISLTASALNRRLHPDNEYLLISEAPSRALLAKWAAIHPALAHYRFREACGMEPCPLRPAFDAWLAAHAGQLQPVIHLPKEKTATLDLSVGSTALGHNRNFEELTRFAKTIGQMLEQAGAEAGIGGYAEVRPFYTTDSYATMGDNGPRWRTVHLGVDVWMPAGTPVHAPLAGKVLSLQDNAGDCNYGPTIILEHEPEPGLRFYTLYGHLSHASLRKLEPGQAVQAGQVIAEIGSPPGNGNWPPHLHFQVTLDLLGNEGDFPGVAFPEGKESWLSLCPDGAPFFGLPLPDERRAKETTDEELYEKRRKHLGYNLSLSYRRPLHMVRGYMQYLYDTNGRRYLDTVNNVPHVGHQHPAVVEAISRQAAVLNTNTRYLHRNIVELAEELLATLPRPLEVVYFVNSGSEANELALRLARTWSEQRDMVVVQWGYHGNTTGCIDISSYKFDRKGGQGAPPHTHVVPMPDRFRGLYTGKNAAGKYAAHVGQAIKAVQAEGRGIAGFICESILSCGGQIPLPQGYLKEVYNKVRKAGGLCIADEVQVGLGRVGDAFWGFELQGVVPDVVTIGKPFGNGHPLAAVVTTRAVAERFHNGMEYFNTFGGNPVSCAAGLAVLRTIKTEGLQEQARLTGNYLREMLTELQDQYPEIGDVRGYGLFLGIELVQPGKKKPNRQLATAIANRMRQCGILMSTDGPDDNVLKIKPPLCFSRENAEWLVEMVGGRIEELSPESRSRKFSGSGEESRN
ncbi:MAG: alanine--glyoxylate aminotransferase [Saprospirales bacterium]|nr:alanine--glyoxylate aminotransferase [Saprospirales bacterium]